MDEILRTGLPALGLTPDAEMLRAFRRYAELLAAGNAVMNLTAIEGEEDTARLHFLDCCALLGMTDFRGKRVVDVGTGAGFPGLPLKLGCPSAELTLLDSQEKRMGFLRETAAALGVSAELVTCRAEEAPAALRETFDIAVSRAVARLNVLCELCLPLVRVGGLFIAMKGPDCADELREAEGALSALRGAAAEVRRYVIPGTDVTHSAVLIRKAQPTPARYPRRWAKILKQPL